MELHNACGVAVDQTYVRTYVLSCEAPQLTYAYRRGAPFVVELRTYVRTPHALKNSGVEHSSGIPQVEDFVEGLAWNTCVELHIRELWLK